MAATFSMADPVPWFREQMYVAITLGVEGETIAHQEGVNLKPRLSKWQELMKAGAVPDTLRFPSATPCSLQIAGGALQFNVWGGSGTMPDSGARFLPWRENFCSYVKLDDAARFVVTGPLTGCNIYVAGDLSAPWFFHANYNKSTGNGETTKRRWPLDLIASGEMGGGPMNVKGSLERANYSTRGYQGLVFGFKKGPTWQFYFWGYSTNGNYMRRMC